MQLQIVYCMQQYAVIHQLDAGMNCTTTLVTKSSNFLVLYADPRCIEVQIQMPYTMMAMDGCMCMTKGLDNQSWYLAYNY